MRYAATLHDKTYIIEINDERHITLDGVPYEVNFTNINNQPIFSLILGGQSYEALITPGEGDQWEVMLRGRQYAVEVEDERERRLRQMAGMGHGHGTGEFTLKAPMPGLVVNVLVSEGQEVRKGETLIILESMKMQNELKSNRPGKIASIKVQAGQGVEQNQPLVVVG